MLVHFFCGRKDSLVVNERRNLPKVKKVGRTLVAKSADTDEVKYYAVSRLPYQRMI